jgi:hypothetical protein
MDKDGAETFHREILQHIEAMKARAEFSALGTDAEKVAWLAEVDVSIQMVSASLPAFLRYKKETEAKLAEALRRAKEDLFGEVPMKANTERNPVAALAEVKRRLGERKGPEEPTNVIQLPLPWPVSMRPGPNPFLRSALFTATKPNGAQVENKEIAALAGLSVTYTGQVLTQKHLTVLLQLIQLGWDQPDMWAKFPANSFLRSLGMSSRGPSQYKQLREYLLAMQLCRVTISTPRYTYYGALILRVAVDEETHNLAVQLNPDIVKLLGRDQYTLLDWELRLRLGRKYLTQALLDLYASHAQPFPYTVEKLRELVGVSRARKLSAFQGDLKASHEELRKLGFLASFSIDNGLVSVKRTASRSQRRHLRSSRSKLVTQVSAQIG